MRTNLRLDKKPMAEVMGNSNSCTSRGQNSPLTSRRSINIGSTRSRLGGVSMPEPKGVFDRSYNVEKGRS